MEQTLEKINEIRAELMIELERAEVLIKICAEEHMAEDLEKKDLCIISRMVLKQIISSTKMAEDIGLELLGKS